MATDFQTPSGAAGASKRVVGQVELLRIVQQALDHAVCIAVDDAMPLGRKNAKRSQNWVTCLRTEFHTAYRQAGENAVKAFCKECGDNKDDFGLNELLHDVCVCRVATVPSRTHKKPLMYVTDVLWQVESEFKNSGAEAIKDFNKLILGSAQNKLFVGPMTSDLEADLAVLVDPAKRCPGEVYVALVAHPNTWRPTVAPPRPRVYHFNAGPAAWIEVGVSSGRTT